METRRLLYLFTVGLLLFVLAVPVHAFPAVTYEGEADAAAIDIGVQLGVGPSLSSVDVIVAGSNATLDGVADTPITTHGDAVSAAIRAGVGVFSAFAGLGVGVNPVETTKTYQDGFGNPLTGALAVDGTIGTAGLITVGANVGVVGTETLSELLPNESFATTMDSDSGSDIESSTVTLATIPLVTTGVLTSDSRTETTAVNPDHDVVSASDSSLAGVVVDLNALGLGALVDDIITADVITANTSAINDGTGATAAANANYSFVNLRINGTEVTITTPHVIVVLDTLEIDVNVHIGPVLSEFVSDTLSEARAVAVRIEVVSTVPLSEANVVIDLGTSHSRAAAADGGNTGPSVIDLVSLTAASPGMTPLALFAVVGLTLASIVLLRRSRL